MVEGRRIAAGLKALLTRTVAAQSDDRREELIETLRTELVAHERMEEEEEMFTKARKILSEGELEELGARVAAIKKEAMAE